LSEAMIEENIAIASKIPAFAQFSAMAIKFVS